MKTLKRLMILAVTIVVSYWGGYWHGRTREVFESGKRHGALPASMTWEQFLDRAENQK